MKKTAILIVAAVLAYGYFNDHNFSTNSASYPATNADQVLQDAYNNRRSDLQVQGQGSVIKLLPDDLKGSQHQRFILKLATSQTVLIAHNIDLAPRIPDLKNGDNVEFNGEYEWNENGGVIHWTHRDPRGKHIGGWLKHQGKIYQ